MSNTNNRINWEKIRELSEEYGTNAVFQRYASFEGVDPTHSALLMDDVDIQPPWDVPPKIAVTTAIVGAMHNKRFNPNHPMAPDEIYESARQACLAGAPSIHIHVRDEEGYSVLDPDMFHQVIDPIREEFPEVVIDGCLVSNSKRDWEIMQVLLKEKLFETTPVNTNATYNGDMLFCKPAHVMIEKLRLVQEAGVKPQITFYSSGDLDNANRYLIRSGLLEPPYNFLLLYALPGCSPMNSPRAMMDTLLNTYNQIMEIDPTSRITVCAAGRASSFLAAQAILMGLNIRVGMEDTVWKYPHKNDLIINNAEQFCEFKTIAQLLGRDVMDTREYREFMGLELPNSAAEK